MNVQTIGISKGYSAQKENKQTKVAFGSFTKDVTRKELKAEANEINQRFAKSNPLPKRTINRIIGQLYNMILELKRIYKNSKDTDVNVFKDGLRVWVQTQGRNGVGYDNAAILGNGGKKLVDAVAQTAKDLK